MKPKVSPRDYAQFVKGLHLESMVTRELHARRLVEKIDLTRQVNLNISDEATFRMAGKDRCVVSHSYQIAVVDVESGDRLVEMGCEFEIGLRVGREMTAAYFEVFSKVSLPVSTWPYLREYTQSVVARMGLPPIVLPLVKRA